MGKRSIRKEFFDLSYLRVILTQALLLLDNKQIFRVAKENHGICCVTYVTNNGVLRASNFKVRTQFSNKRGKSK